MLKFFIPSCDDLKQMRKDAGFSRDELAFFLHKDPGKFQRVGKIERDEIEPTFSEGIKWMNVCAKQISLLQNNGKEINNKTLDVLLKTQK